MSEHVPTAEHGRAPLDAGSGRDTTSFDHYARLAKRLLQVPASLVSVVEAERQVFPGAAGLVSELMESRQTPLAYSFCQYVVDDEKPLVIDDARLDPRLRDNPAIDEYEVIAYIGFPLTDANGRTVGSVCALDSTPRAWTADDVEALEDLARACSAEWQRSHRLAEDGERLARTIFAATDTALAFYDSDGALVLANERALHVADVGGFRLDLAPHGGVHAYRSDSHTPVPLEDQIIPRFLRGDLRSHGLQWLGRPGRQVAISGSAQQVHRADGTTWGTLVALQDVTDLARALEVKGELIATVSHELRTPLTVIRGYVDLLTEQLGGDEGFVAHALATITRAGLSMQSRIDELLDAGVRQWALDLEPTDVGALVQGVVATFAESAGRGLVDLTVDCGPCTARVDPARFEQVLENLVSNAVKFTGRGGRVAVSLRASDDEVLVDVADTGVGMTEDEVSQAFDTFWRSDGARRSAVQGFGIGLAVVRSLVEAHNGSVSVTTEPGTGTTVTVTVPRRPPLN